MHSHDTIRKMLDECGGIRAEAARRLGMSTRALFSQIDQMKSAGIDVPETSYTGRVTGTSTLLGPDGETKLQWVKQDNRPSPEAIAAAVRDALSALDARPRVKAPRVTRKDLLVVYPIGDQHVGMYAWAEEAGEDYDIKTAERLLAGAVHHLVDVSPPADEAMIVDVGDFEHYDTIKAETTRSHNTLDSDSRYHVMIRAAFRMMCAAIERALEKHRRVTVICSPGNHNDMGAAWKVESLALIYRGNPRVEIVSKAGKFHYHEFGKVLLGVTHGDTGKPEKLSGVMAADQPEAWGRTRHRHWLTGHVHNKSVIEFPGVTWETFRTLAGRDAWTHGAGYRAGREMLSIIYHREHGEIGRHRFDVGMMR